MVQAQAVCGRSRWSSIDFYTCGRPKPVESDSSTILIDHHNSFSLTNSSVYTTLQHRCCVDKRRTKLACFCAGLSPAHLKSLVHRFLELATVNSYRVIVVLNLDFVDNEWGQYELDQALMLKLEDAFR